MSSEPISFSGRRAEKDDLLKNLTLFLLAEVILRRRYREIRMIVRLARNFGAERREISSVLQPRRKVRARNHHQPFDDPKRRVA